MSWRTDPQHRLVFGAVDFTDPTSGLCVLSDSSNSWGSPQPVTSVVDSLLMDGSLVKWEHDDNRTVTFLAAAMAEDSIALAQAEARLVAELSRRNTLSWTPPDGLGPTTVFRVLTSSAEMVPVPGTALDVSEMNLIRCFSVTLTCAAHAQSSSPSVVSSVAQAPGSPVVISSGSSATGWSTGVSASGGWLSEAPTYSSYAPNTGSPDGVTTWGGSATFTFGTAQNFAATPFLYVDSPRQMAFVYGGITFTVGGVSPRLRVNGARQSTPPMMTFTSPDDATCVRYVFSVGGFTAASTLTFDFKGAFASGGPVGAPSPMRWQSLTRAPNMPGVSTKETLLSFPVGGSVRTPGSLQIASAASTVGDALVYTASDLANGFIPSLRRYRTSGNTVSADATAWSGFSEPMTSSPVIFDIPVSTLAEGGYTLMSRLKSWTMTGAQSVTWTAQLRTGAGVNVGPPQATVLAGPVAIGSTFTLFQFGAVMLPPTAVPAESTAVVRITMPAGTAMAGAVYDDFYLFRRGDDTALTIVQGAAKNLWIDSPTIDQPAPRIYTGTAADRSDAYGAASTALSWEQHTYHPGSTLAYIVCNASDAVTTLTYTKAWHTNAAEPGDG